MSKRKASVEGVGRAIPDDRIRLIRKEMLSWYRRAARDLPWRREADDGYRVLVSELMLQQTQVDRVVDYYQRFVATFPTVQSLAQADEQAVLRLWEGLGYYRRAKHLHAAAKAIVNEHGGRMPRTATGLASLPGVGAYTAGAVASIAFGERAAAVDGNVMRVLSRWFAVEDPVDTVAGKGVMAQLAEALVSPEDPGGFNQSLMELGATVCTPRRPGCGACPAAGWCEAGAMGAAEAYPKKGARAAPGRWVHHVLAVEAGGRVLLIERPEKGLWSNMWALPTIEMPEEAGGRDGAGEGLPAGADELLGAVGWLEVDGWRWGGELVWQTTHRSIRFVLWRGMKRSGRLRPGAGAWRRAGGAVDLPMPTPYRKLLALLGDV